MLICTRILSLFTQILFVSRSRIILNTKLKKYVPHIQDALCLGFKFTGQLLGERPAPPPSAGRNAVAISGLPASWESQKTYL